MARSTHELMGDMWFDEPIRNGYSRLARETLLRKMLPSVNRAHIRQGRGPLPGGENFEEIAQRRAELPDIRGNRRPLGMISALQERIEARVRLGERTGLSLEGMSEWQRVAMGE